MDHIRPQAMKFQSYVWNSLTSLGFSRIIPVRINPNEQTYQLNFIELTNERYQAHYFII